MSYIALARKWRPRTFSELLGQNHLTTALINSLNQKRIHHAYLFTGTRGVGKTSVARLLAKALNCEQGVSSQPCLTCDSCLAVEQGRFIDLIEIDGASKTRVEDTREILENVQYAPTNGRFKIYLIDEVHMLSQHSFNALLKTLEEPPAHVKFLLATTDPQKLPITVLSRCLQFNLKHVPEDIISGHLQHILQQETLTFEPQALTLLAKAARGSMRDALSLLDQAIASCNNELSTQQVKDMLGFTQQDYALLILRALLAGDAHQLITISRQIAQDSGHFRYVLDEIINHLHQIAVCQALPNASQLIEANHDVKALGSQFAPEDTQLMYQIALKGTEDMPLAPTMEIGFEMTLLRMHTFRPSPEQTRPVKLHETSSSPINKSAQNQITAYDDSESSIASVSLASPSLIQNPEVMSEVYDSKARFDAPSESRECDENNKSSVGMKEGTEESEQSWIAILPQLNLRGLALSAAENAQILSKSPGQVVLQLEKAHQSLFTPPVISRIEEALSRYYSEKIKIVLEYGEQIPSSPAIQKKITQEKLHQNAEAALYDDPFFQQLRDEFSAELLKNSIASLKEER
ncbi:MAG: DNA polymerase III subunit gamma/tau [Legionellaceae bacterium]|nr:DNA polymerase III subunit gamma/tau [Legionellaceae bacterium]